MRHSRRVVVIGAMLVAVIVTIGVSFGIYQVRSNGAPAATIDPEEYPAFTADYVETVQENGATVSRTWKLEYNNLRDWRKEMVAVSGYTGPAKDFQVGTVWASHQDTLSITYPKLDKPIVTKHPEGFIPFYWLHAGRLSYLKNTGTSVQVSPGTSGEQVVTYGNNKVTLNARGVPIQGDLQVPVPTQFTAQSFAFK